MPANLTNARLTFNGKEDPGTLVSAAAFVPPHPQHRRDVCLTPAHCSLGAPARAWQVVGSAQTGFTTYQKPVEARGPPLPLKKNRQKAFAAGSQSAPQQAC